MRCPVTRGRISGRSKTCRRSTGTTSASASSPAQPAHASGAWTRVRSGVSTCSNAPPGEPFGLPGPRPEGLRNDFGLAKPSLDGGFEEFREFIPNCRRSSVLSARNVVFSALSSAISTLAAASSVRTWDNSARNSPTSPASSA
jgi:hypothetical protein